MYIRVQVVSTVCAFVFELLAKTSGASIVTKRGLCERRLLLIELGLRKTTWSHMQLILETHFKFCIVFCGPGSFKWICTFDMSALRRSSVPFLTTGLLHGDEGRYPCLTLKAHAGKIFAMYLVTCLQTLHHMKPDNLEIQMAHLATQQLLRWFHLQEIAPRFITAEQAKDIASAGYAFLRFYQRLAQLACANSRFLWKILPKMHVPLLIFGYSVYSRGFNCTVRTAGSCFASNRWISI